MYTRRKIENLSKKLLMECSINSAGFRIERVAENLGIQILKKDLGSDVFGVLYVRNGIGTIGISPLQGKNRMRFTIAHEIGHYVLHRHEKDLFIDKNATFFRKSKISPKDRIQEREANAFAAAILMPKHILERQIQNLNLFEDLSDDQEETNCIEQLAKKFKVSKTAMTYRISNLGLLNEF